MGVHREVDRTDACHRFPYIDLFATLSIWPVDQRIQRHRQTGERANIADGRDIVVFFCDHLGWAEWAPQTIALKGAVDYVECRQAVLLSSDTAPDS